MVVPAAVPPSNFPRLLGQADEDHGAIAVQIVAEADLIAPVHLDGGNFDPGRSGEQAQRGDMVYWWNGKGKDLWVRGNGELVVVEPLVVDHGWLIVQW